jgi:hypothetical protein
MKQFILKIALFFAVTLFMMLLLDLAYTKVYQTSSPRTKIQFLRTLKDQKIDYIFIGSSRVESGIVPSIIEKKTGKKALNLGFQAAKLHDIYTLLQLVQHYKIKHERIFIQVDYSYNINQASTIFQPEIIPFMHENEIYDNHLKFDSIHYNQYRYIPFFRYARNDLKLGFREICLNLAKKKTNAVTYQGYSPLYGNAEKHHFPLPDKIHENNQYIKHIQKFCKKNKINVTFYTAPFCQHTTNLGFISQLKTKIPGLYDFSRTVKDENLFQNANHLNDNGAQYFTEIFADEVLTNK